MNWSVLILNQAVEEELNQLPKDMRAKFTRISYLIENFGLEKVGNPHVKHIQDSLWEIRMIGRDGIARGLYVTVTGKKVVVVRFFIKKTQKTPQQEIALALQRAKGILK